MHLIQARSFLCWRLPLKSHKYPALPIVFWWQNLRDKYQEELNRQRTEQARLEEAMNRQEPQSKRDEQLGMLDQWLDKQEKGSGRTKSG